MFQSGNIPVALQKTAKLKVIHSEDLLCGDPELIKIFMEKITQVSNISKDKRVFCSNFFHGVISFHIVFFVVVLMWKI